MTTPYSPDDLRDHIRSTLQLIKKWNPDIEELMLATGAHESHLGLWMTQNGGGPAVGVFGMEPATEQDNWKNYLSYRMDKGEIGDLISRLTGVSEPTPLALTNNLTYAICQCRVKYLRCPIPLPKANDIQGLADYWFLEYNGSKVDHRHQFIADYRRLILGLNIVGD